MANIDTSPLNSLHLQPAFIPSTIYYNSATTPSHPTSTPVAPPRRETRSSLLSDTIFGKPTIHEGNRSPMALSLRAASGETRARLRDTKPQVTSLLSSLSKLQKVSSQYVRRKGSSASRVNDVVIPTCLLYTSDAADE